MPLDLPPGDREAPDSGLLDAYSHAVSGERVAIARPIDVLVVRRDRTLATLTATPVESAPRGG